MGATVIIPTTGAPELRKAIQSVLDQTYDTTCYVVVDGEQNYGKSSVILSEFGSRVKYASLPINVGANGFYGHRVYAAFTHLVNTDYVLYLDQDNWLEPNHVMSCVKTIEDVGVDWCYSLRNIYEGDKFICHDDCERNKKQRPWS